MSITSTSWMEQDEMSLGCDVHVVHGDPSPGLLDRLQVTVSGVADTIMSAEKYLAEGQKDVTLEFQPLFRGTEASERTRRMEARC